MPILAKGSPSAESSYEEVLLSVTINQQDLGEVTTFLQTSHGEILASADDLQRWHFRSPRGTPITYENKRFYKLHSFPGLNYVIDSSQMRIDLTAPPSLLTTNTIDASRSQFVKPTPSSAGGFVNYDINGQSATQQSQIGAIVEPAFFNRYGVGASSFLFQQNNGSDLGTLTPGTQLVRLNTTWTHDNPSLMRTTRFGDAYNATGLWGRAVDFGGVQWGTNFNTQPSFITFPLPSVSGEALVPSVVDLYVNNAQVSNKAIPPGPFSINYIPVITGQGTLNIVTTDLLGRQQVLNLPYYASQELLRKGLNDYSYEAGFIRDNFGMDSNSYGRFMMTGTQRCGLTDRLTCELHEEILDNQQTMGIGGSYLLSTWGVISVAAATSRANGQGMGALGLVGFQHQTIHGISYGINTQFTSSQFAQLGFGDSQFPPSLVNQAFLGLTLPANTSLGLAYTQQNNRCCEANAGFVNLSLTKPLGKWSLNLSLLVDVSGNSQNGAFLTVTRSLGQRTTLNVGGISQSQTNQGYAELAQSLPVGTGYGYDLLASAGEQSNYQASVSAQNNIGTYAATAADQAGASGVRLEARGSAVTLDQKVYLTREIPDSFGVVQIPGYPYVDVYDNNQLIGNTDKNGNVLVPDLLSYRNNDIRIDQNQLPLNAQVDATELNVIPYYRSGLLIKFPVQPSHAAVVHLIQADGTIVPPGAMVTVEKHQQSFPVGEEGMVYITGLANHTTLTARWDDAQCRFSINYPATTDPQPDLGTLRCE